MNALKGFSAISIIVGHIGVHCSNYAKEYLKQTPYGLISVYPAFFFCSGYGIIKSYKNKTDYLNYVLNQKIIFKILIPFYLSNFFILCYIICYHYLRWHIFN